MPQFKKLRKKLRKKNLQRPEQIFACRSALPLLGHPESFSFFLFGDHEDKNCVGPNEDKISESLRRARLNSGWMY